MSPTFDAVGAAGARAARMDSAPARGITGRSAGGAICNVVVSAGSPAAGGAAGVGVTSGTCGPSGSPSAILANG
jgi:hypothetical protein